MKALLFILAVSMGLAALAARRHLSRTLDADDDDSPHFTESIRTSETAVKNLNDAINRISGKPAAQPATPAAQGIKRSSGERAGG